MDFQQTRKGLLRADFKDRYGQECSVQESSMPGEDCLWLGVDVGQDGKPVTYGRMHLSRDQARMLIPILRHFARTGTLGVDEPQAKFQIGAQVVGVGESNHGIEGRIVELKKDRYMAVQDLKIAGPSGYTICTWDQADLIWVPLEREQAPSAFERITADE